MKFQLTLIRHGKTPANEEGRYLGRTDESLSEKGRREITDKYPGKLRTDKLFSSPMKRCLETAGLIFENDEVCVINEFREMDFGDFEMKNYAELDGNAEYQAWIDSGGKGCFPNGESRKEFIDRVDTGLKKLMDICSHTNTKTASAIVHGGTVMAVMHLLTGEDYFSFQVKNAEGFIITGDTDLNDISYDRISCRIHP